VEVPLRRCCCALFLLPLIGCGGAADQPERVWGRQGVVAGDLMRPRALAIEPKTDRLFVVDFTARIQVYDRDGTYQGITWQTPDYRKGRPSGLAFDRDGNLLVCDSHYHCIRVYTPTGELVRTLGGRAGSEHGELGYVSDVVQAGDGTYFVGEFGANQRVSVFDADFKFVRTWGQEGTEPGQFLRIRALALGPDGLLYVVDVCNHRVQVFDREGNLQRVIGKPGEGRGELSYPFDLAFTPEGHLAVVEHGNHRVQLFSPEGKSLAVWGGPGRSPGKFHSPWALAVDKQGAIHVLDTENHRVQRIRVRPEPGFAP
jgi:DNA-binding beta-propeller fold protein YncE